MYPKGISYGHYAPYAKFILSAHLSTLSALKVRGFAPYKILDKSPAGLFEYAFEDFVYIFGVIVVVKTLPDLLFTQLLSELLILKQILQIE